MSRITNKGATSPLSLFQASTDPSFGTYCGERFDLSDGREVVLVQAGAVDLGSGVLIQAPAIISDHQNMTTSTKSIGATTITVSLGATAVTANQYAGGYLNISAGTGQGQFLKIASHPAAALSTNVVITLEDPLVLATNVGSTKSGLIPNLYVGAVINPFAAATNTPIGVTFYPITAANYGYLISKGPTAILADGALTVGAAISPSNAVDGAVEDGVIAQGFVGRALQAGVTTESRTVYVDL